MATRNQHFVPRVYLKAWETKVETKKEPHKQFDGVYCFNKGDTIGDGTTREAILWKPHLYTINFRQLYLAKKCPKVYNFFVNEIFNLMRTNKPQPVYGKLGYSLIKTKRSVHKHLYDIDNWDFYYDNGTIARKKALLNRFNDMNCYLLEDSFSGAFEKNWESIFQTFIDEVKHALPTPGLGLDRKITEKAVKDMMEFFFMMFCRSPQFDGMGVYEWINSILKLDFTGVKEVKEIMDAVWFTELYKMFYKGNGVFITLRWLKRLKIAKLFFLKHILMQEVLLHLTILHFNIYHVLRPTI